MLCRDVAALMISMFLGRFPFRSADLDPGPLWFAATLAAICIAIWVAHGFVGVTIGQPLLIRMQFQHPV